MGEPDLQRVRDVVLGAAGLSGDERREFLARVCGADDALRRAAEDVLALDQEDIDSVRGLADGGLRAWLETPVVTEPVVEPDISFDRYELREEIGRGGSSVVHRAQQIEPVAREVALKILRTRRLDPLARERFLAEQQVLAGLEHSNVARVFDAGTTGEGLPFFAMEFVRGPSITEYAGGLGLRGRVRLFLQACAGVEHAHRRGIIHRDLKPTNVLVSEHDGQPVVKVIDFGIARPLDRQEDPRFTLAGHMLGTPQYMSPEQARGERDRIDVRSDVFSLGVVLHEMLSGRVPYDVDPDTTLSLLGAVSRGEVVRSATDDRSRTLPVDLRAILDRALEIDPDARYDACSDLSRDLKNYLDGRPVAARRGGRLYPFRKLTSRHPLATGLAAALLLLIVSSSITATILYKRAEREAEIARRQSATATSLAEYLQGMFAASGPTGGDRHVTMAETLDMAVTRAEDDLVDQPFVLAQVLRTIGDVKADLGESDASHSLWSRAVDLLDGLEEPGAELLRWTLAKNIANATPEYPRMRREVENLVHGVEASGLATDEKARLVYLAWFRLADAAGREQMLVEADTFLAAAAEVLPDLPGDIEPLRLQLAYARGRGFGEIGDYPRARDFLGEALEGYQKYLGDEDNRTLVVMNRLAAAETGLGFFEQAMQRHTHILSTGRELLGPDHVRMGYFHLAHAITQTLRGNPAIGRLEAKRASEIFQETKTHPDKTFADADFARGLACLGLARYVDAEAAFARAIDCEEQLPRARPFSMIRDHTGRGRSLHGAGRLEEAARAFESSLHVASEHSIRDGVALAETWIAVACLEIDRGEFRAALTSASTASSILGDEYPGNESVRLFARHAHARARVGAGEEEAGMRDLVQLEPALFGSFSHMSHRRHAIDRSITLFAAHGDRDRVVRYQDMRSELEAHARSDGPASSGLH